MGDLPSTFKELSNLETYLRMRPAVSNYLLQIIGEVVPDCIVTIARKSHRILSDILESEGMDTVRIIRDTELCSEDINDRSIMVFDDSIHTGGSIKGCVDTIRRIGSPSGIHIVSLLSNREGLQYLKDNGLGEYHVDSFKTFYNYKEQSEEYNSWMFSLIEGTKNKLGYEFVSEKICFRCDMKIIEELLLETFNEQGYISTPLESEISEHNRVRNLSFSPQVSDEVEGWEFPNPKIRANIIGQDAGCLLVLEYMVFPEDINVLAEACNDENISYKICMYGDKTSKNCLKCILLESAIKYIRKFDSVLLRSIERNGIPFNPPEYCLPSKEKYPAELRLQPDAISQLKR